MHTHKTAYNLDTSASIAIASSSPFTFCPFINPPIATRLCVLCYPTFTLARSQARSGPYQDASGKLYNSYAYLAGVGMVSRALRRRRGPRSAHRHRRPIALSKRVLRPIIAHMGSQLSASSAKPGTTPVRRRFAMASAARPTNFTLPTNSRTVEHGRTSNQGLLVRPGFPQIW